MHIQPSPDPRSQVRMPYLPCPILASNAEKKETKRENSRVEEKERNPNRGLLSHPLPLTSSSRWIPPAPPPAGALRLLSPDPPSSLPRPPSSSARWLCSFRRNRKLVELVAPLVVPTCGTAEGGDCGFVSGWIANYLRRIWIVAIQTPFRLPPTVQSRPRSGSWWRPPPFTWAFPQMSSLTSPGVVRSRRARYSVGSSRWARPSVGFSRARPSVCIRAWSADFALL